MTEQDEDPVDSSAAERTAFSCHRSGLAFAAIGLVLLRRTLPNIPERPTNGALLIAAGFLSVIGAVVYQERNYSKDRSSDSQMRLVFLYAMTMGVLALALGFGI